MLLDGIAASEAVDKSGEKLSLAGMDISDFVQQKAPLDFEHAAEHQAKKGEGEGQWIEEKGKRPGASDIIGRVLYGKKIFRREDAENDRQRAYWDRIGLPYLYFIAELYDDDGHAGAQEVAAIIRNGKRTGRGIVFGVSVGGATLERDGPDGKGNTLTGTVARSLACTLRPCNASCQIDILGDQTAVMKTDRLVGWTTLEGIDPEVDAALLKSIPSSLVQDAALAPEALDKAAPGNGTDAVVPRLEALTVALGQALPPAAAPDALWPGGPTVHDVRMIDPASQSAIRSGRFMMLDGSLHHLEDHHGLLARVLPEGPVTPLTHQIVDGLHASPYLTVSPDHDFLAGHPGLHPTLGRLPEAPLDETAPAPAAPPSPPEGIDGVEAYHYARAGADPVLLEVSGDDAYLDGRPVPASLLRLMMQNVRLGVATLAPAPRPEEGLVKDESAVPGIMSPATALDHIRRAVAYGHLHPDVADAMTHHIYSDKMTPTGNKYAWEQFRAKGKPGVYISVDGNSMKAINDTFGHDAGDQAIVSMGRALRNASDEMGRGAEGVKLFRNPDQEDLWRSGGDEFQVHAPSYEHAVRFLDLARKHLDAATPIGGTHKISASFGLGHTPQHADAALYEAKKGKLTETGASKYPAGQIPNLGHSAVAGREGPLKLHSEAPPPVPPAPKG